MLVLLLLHVPPLLVHLSRNSDFTAGEPERTLVAGVDTLVLLDADIKGRAKRVGLALNVCGTGLNFVDDSERDGLFESQQGTQRPGEA
jgi:hypothetical protein